MEKIKHKSCQYNNKKIFNKFKKKTIDFSNELCTKKKTIDFIYITKIQQNKKHSKKNP